MFQYFSQERWCCTCWLTVRRKGPTRASRPVKLWYVANFTFSAVQAGSCRYVGTSRSAFMFWHRGACESHVALKCLVAIESCTPAASFKAWSGITIQEWFWFCSWSAITIQEWFWFCSWSAITISKNGFDFVHEVRSILFIKCKNYPRMVLILFMKCNNYPKLVSIVFMKCKNYPRMVSILFKCNNYPRMVSILFMKCNNYPRMVLILFMKCNNYPKKVSILFMKCVRFCS